MSAALSAFLNKNLRNGKVHTHTCFANGRTPRPLHVNAADVQDLRQLIVAYVKDRTRETLSTGVLSLTEKVPRDPDAYFRFFVDIDFKTADIFEAFNRSSGQQGSSKTPAIREWTTTVMCEIIELFREIVSKELGLDTEEVDLRLATRLEYKIHLYFARVVVCRAQALALFGALENAFRTHPLYALGVLDKSVYSSGLRIVWSHKGAMDGNKMDRVQKERREHEDLFGAGSWSGIYELTDPVTWEKKTERTVADLEATSILAGQDDVPSKLVTPVASGHQHHSKKKQTTAAITGKATSSTAATSAETTPTTILDPSCDETELSVSESLKDALKTAFALSENLDTPCRRGDAIIFPVRSRTCPYAKREHHANHIYVVLSQTGAELRCHNATCKKKKAKALSMERLAGSVRTEAETLLGIGLDSNGLEQIRQSVREAAAQWPGLDISELGIPERSGLDSSPGYLTQLTRNRYCPICRREHDAASNCILTTAEWQRLICARTFLTDQIPTSSEHTTIFAAISNNVNVSVNVRNKDDEDGEFKEVFAITQDELLNELLLESFGGMAYDIGKVIHYLGRRCLGLGNSGDKDVWWVWDKVSRKWQKSTRLAGVFLSENVADIYKTCREWFKNNTADDKLAKVRVDKMDGILRRLRDRDKQIILKQAAEIFEAREKPIEDQLDSNPYLVGFEGDVYDLRTDSARQAEPDDYVSLSVGYPFPYEDDEVIQTECLNMIRGMQPMEAEMDYLLRYLASTLDGCNTEEIFTIWTGGGRNGKSLLVDLMRHTLSEKGYFHPLQASFLTNERPSSSKPCPDLLNIRGKRFACASEPEGDKKMNAGFVKLLTGNDMLTGSFKHSNQEEKFCGQHSLVLLCNGIPAMDAKDDALWLRSRVVEFSLKFVVNPRENTNERLRDDSLKKKIAGWGPQFMRILLRYYKRYQSEGLQPTEAVLRATGSVQRENDPFHEFIEEHYELTGNATDRVPKSEVNEAFENWCQKTPEYRTLCKRKFKAYALLKQAMSVTGFDLGEETVNGRTKVRNKSVNGESQPAYDFIIRKTVD